MAGIDGTGQRCNRLKTPRRTLWVLLAAVAGLAQAQDESPDEDFLAFLGGLEADDDWEDFFDSVPDDAPDPVVLASEDETEERDEAD